MTRKLKVGSFVLLDGVIENPTKIAGSCFDEEVREYSLELGRRRVLTTRSRCLRDVRLASETKGDKYADPQRHEETRRLLTLRRWRERVVDKGRRGGRACKDQATAGRQHREVRITKLGLTGTGPRGENLRCDRKLGGKRAFEDVDRELVRLKLVDTHRFKNGVMVLTYVPQ